MSARAPHAWHSGTGRHYRPRPGCFGCYLDRFAPMSRAALIAARAAAIGTTHYSAHGRAVSNYARALERALKDSAPDGAVTVAGPNPARTEGR